MDQKHMGYIAAMIALSSIDIVVCSYPHMSCYSAGDWQNNYDGYLNTNAQYFFNGVADSVHDNDKEDRMWRFRYCNPHEGYPAFVSTNFLTRTDYDATWNKECSTNAAIIGVTSSHNNHKEDRIWDWKCGTLDSNRYQLTNCQDSGYVNTWDERFSYSCPNNGVIHRVYSYHDNNKEDRRFGFECCRITHIPTQSPTPDPTPAPTNIPSAAPTIPTIDPTPAPTDCPFESMATFNWNTLTRDGIDIPEVNFTISVDDSDLSLNIEVDVQYIVRAYADYQPTPNFGTTYVLDFDDFDAHASSVDLPGTCSNRLESDYTGDSDTYFAMDSYDTHDIGTIRNMCYPPPGEEITGWSIDATETCESVRYTGKWSWKKLSECRNNAEKNGELQTSVNEDENYLTLSGTFYVNMVSPFWPENNDALEDFYRVYQLVSQPFIIQVSKSVYVIGNTGINVMTMSVIATYKSDDNSDYTIILLTETAEYMALSQPTLIEPESVQPQYTLQVQTESENDNCLNNKAYLCSQLWKIEATDTICTTDFDENTGNGGIDFSNTYKLKFDPICRESNGESGYDFNTHCTEWVTEHPSFDATNEDYKGVLLSTNLVFMDQICESKIFTVQMNAEMTFYEDEFAAEKAIGAENNNLDYLYQVGESTIYTEIELNFPIDTETIFGSTLVNVWLCTFPPNTEIADPEGINGGCFSDSRDGFEDGSESDFFYHIFSSQTTIAEKDFVLVDDGVTNSNIIQFTFLCPDKIERDTLYIHAQVEVLLQEAGQRRRVLLNIPNTANKFSHFGKDIGITNNPINNEPNIPPQQPINNKPNINEPIQKPLMPAAQSFLNTQWIIIAGVLLIIILSINIVFMCCKSVGGRRQTFSFNKRRRSGYDSVKHIDSEDFDGSDANLINVN